MGELVYLADYRAKRKSSGERINEALQRWQTAAWAMDPAGTYKASCDFYAALFEDAVEADEDGEPAA